MVLPLVLVTLVDVLIGFVRGKGNIPSFIKNGFGLLVKYTSDKVPWARRLIQRLREIILWPQSSGFAFRLYRRIEPSETKILVRLINSRADIGAWYSPTAFWPEFNEIRGPKLMCVPDVVLSDFPVGFSIVGDDRMMHAFTRVQAAVRGANNYVTYSEDVKWNTLVRRYGIDPENVNVVPHGNNSLSDFLNVGMDEASSVVDEVCRTHLLKALRKSFRPEYTADGSDFHFEYLFYASQVRPNKNVLTLLRAYEWLLRHRYAGVKLILTGNLDVIPEIRRFIETHGLELDVLCLRGLSVRQLAACYRMARLAVNPSLSEGGFPFTFDEALSVGTPVVMSRIGVTEEVITDPALQAEMLFDPYDWQDMARKIAWALENREQLLQRQKPIYDSRTQRTWAHVVDDYVSLLDRISSKSVTPVSLS
jgi:glycosyltransferase involved in cell wall biosynthesis